TVTRSFITIIPVIAHHFDVSEVGHFVPLVVFAPLLILTLIPVRGVRRRIPATGSLNHLLAGVVNGSVLVNTDILAVEDRRPPADFAFDRASSSSCAWYSPTCPRCHVW